MFQISTKASFSHACSEACLKYFIRGIFNFQGEQKYFHQGQFRAIFQLISQIFCPLGKKTRESLILSKTVNSKGVCPLCPPCHDCFFYLKKKHTILNFITGRFKGGHESYAPFAPRLHWACLCAACQIQITLFQFFKILTI